MIEDAVIDLAEELVSARSSVRPLADSTRNRYSAASVEVIAGDLRKATDFRQRDALGLLLVERQLQEAKVSRDARDLDAAVFRLAQHYKTTAGSREADKSSRACASELAELLFEALLRPPGAALAQLREERSFFSGVRPTWPSTTGLDSDRCKFLIGELGKALRQQDDRGPGSDHHYLLKASQAGVLPWVVLGPPDKADQLMLDQSPWTGLAPTEKLDAGDVEIARAAILAMSDGLYEVGGRLADELGSRLGDTWGPSRTFEYQNTWNALRAARHLGAVGQLSSSEKRLNALSAYELLVGLRVPDDVRIYALAGAVDGLEAVSGVAGDEWTVTHARLFSVGNHEEVVEGLDNGERAVLRKRLGAESNTNDLALDLQAQRRELLSEIRSSFPEHTLDKARRRHARWKQFLLPLEEVVLNDVNGAVSELNRTRRADHGAERTTALIAARSHLVSVINAVVECGSAVVEEVTLPTLQLLLREIEDASGQAQRSSRPRLSVVLQTDRLPLRSDSDNEFVAILDVENTGNVSALGSLLEVDSSSAVVATQPDTITRLRPGEIRSERVTLRRSEPLDQIGLVVTTSWTDELGQAFHDEHHLVAEAETQSRWTSSDVNPYRLEPVRQRERLFGRDSEMAALAARLASGESLFVTGKKRVGKSSLVAVALANLGQSGKATQRVPFGYLQADAVSQIVENLLITVADLLADCYGDVAPELPPFDEGSATHTAGRWLNRVTRTLPADAGVVLAIDDFDELPGHFWESAEGSTLFVFLRALVEEPWLSVVFVGSEVMPSLMRRHGYKLNQVGRFDLSALGRVQDTAALLRSPSSDHIEWDDDAVRSAHVATAGNPYYSTLVARELWDRMRARDRSYVAPTDVESCLLHLAKSAESDHFVHLWADDTSGIDTGSEAATQNAAILFAIAQCSATGESAERDEILNFASMRSGPDARPRLADRLESLIARGVVVEVGERSLTHEIPIVQAWFRESAASLLGAKLRALADAATEVAYISDRKLLDLTRDFRFGGEMISEIRVRDWLDQFSDPGAKLAAFRMLERLRSEYYLDGDALQASGAELRSWISDAASLNHPLPPKGYTNNVWLVCPFETDLPAIRATANGARVPQKSVLTLSEALRELSVGAAVSAVIVVTTFDGTGDETNAALSQLQQSSRDPDLSLGVFSIASLKAEPWVHLETGRTPRLVHRQLSAKARPFSSADGCVGEGGEADRLRNLFSQIGHRLTPERPLGWPANGLLMLFETLLPVYMPPVFWASGVFGGEDWKPLFAGAPAWEGDMPRANDDETERVRGLMAKGEGDTCEFKASLRTDWPSGGTNKEREFDVTRAVAGLMNGEGGSLLIGVNDAGQPVGLAADYDSSRNIGNADGFERHLRTAVSNALPGVMPTDIRVKFVTIDGLEICYVLCNRAVQPLWHKKDGGEVFFVRRGPGAVPYEGTKLSTYLQRRFTDNQGGV